MSETPRQTAERLAAERYPMVDYYSPRKDARREGYVSGYLDGRTVTAEQVEAGGKALCRAHQGMDGDYPWNVQFEDGKEEYRGYVRAAFRAAGMTVEGEE